MANLKLNTVQLRHLRIAASVRFGLLPSGDRCTTKALISRGFAKYGPPGVGGVFITDAGRERAKSKADIHVVRDGVRDDPSLMEDL